ncbi:MAG: hypothetical protein PWP23_3224 [Candidatus Sumerlaeota bacterium]|nr:hypothetical protein [Candidatus Sumerlaeota bacterium]
MSRARAIPNPENASAADLDTAASAGASELAKRRLQAMKALILGATFEFTCALFNTSERTLRRWVAAFNAQGIDGLIDRRHPGRPKAIQAEQAAYFEKVIEDPTLANETHWTARKFHGWLTENTEVEVSYRTVVRLFHERGFALKVPRPWPDRQDEEAREAFREKLEQLMADNQIELWFQDEMGVEGDPRPRRRWAKKGSKPTVTKNGDHLRMNVCGMICPRTGEAFLLEFSHSDREVFQIFLDEANKDLVLERTRQILIMDNASWHKSKSLQWGRFEPLYLPPYSPDMNPIERLWLIIKANWFTDFVAKTREQLMERLDKALCWAMNRKTLNTKTCAIRS